MEPHNTEKWSLKPESGFIGEFDHSKEGYYDLRWIFYPFICANFDDCDILSKRSYKYILSTPKFRMLIPKNEVTIMFQDSKNPLYYICQIKDLSDKIGYLAIHKDCFLERLDVPPTYEHLEYLLNKLKL